MSKPAKHEHECGAPLTADCDGWCSAKYDGWLTSESSASPACSIAPWTKFDDQMPPANAAVLVCSKEGSIYLTTVDGLFLVWQLEHYTHWMPLPEPPAQWNDQAQARA